MPATRSRVLLSVLLLAVSGLFFIALQANPVLDAQLGVNSPAGHFYIVSAASLANVVLGVTAAAAALRATNTRVLLLALSFLSMSVIFAIHGLATPGFLLDVRFAGVTAFTSRLSVLVATAFLATSVIEWPANDSRRGRRVLPCLLGGWAAALAGFAVVALASPESLPPALLTHTGFQYASAGLVLVFAGYAALRYFEGYVRSGLPMYGAVAVGSVLIMQAQISMHFGATWGATFWLYHVQLLVAFSAVLLGIATEYQRGKSPRLAMEQLGADDVQEQIRAGYTESIVGLAAALEARDGYTIGHGERVAALAVMIAQELRLPTRRLRALSQGALLHDIGKIGVPDAVLHKPGALDDDEMALIKEHPGRGNAVLGAAFTGGRYEIERAVIRHHHERWDGSGYPDGLSGDAVMLEARITAVADVYDALRSARSYRTAWTREDAREHVSEGAGSHFDPVCVEAFLKVGDGWEAAFAADAEDYSELRAAS